MQKPTPFLTPRKIWAFAVAAVLVAALIAFQSRPAGYEQTLARIQAHTRLAALGPDALAQPPAVRAQLFRYAGQPSLAMQAWLALHRYPRQTPRILEWYGQSPAFARILDRYGPQVIPVIDYFIVHPIGTLTALNAASRAAETIARRWQALWHPSAQHSAASSAGAAPLELTPRQRGWIAIQDIRQEGNRFLGQFDIDASGHAHWNTVDRITVDLGQFLGGGLARVERKRDLGEPLTAGDIGWAAVDAAPLFAGLKLLKLGKAGLTAARQGKAMETVDAAQTQARITEAGKAAPATDLSLTAKDATGAKQSLATATGRLARSLAPPLLRKTAWLAGAYLLVTHPALLSSLFLEAGKRLGIPAWLALLAGWTALLYLLLFPALWLLERILRPALRLLEWLGNAPKPPPPGQRT